MPDEVPADRLLALTADIVSAHVSHNRVTPDGVSALITSVYQTLTGIGTNTAEPEKPEPFVAVKKSVFADHIVCLGCGKTFSMLKRHLKTDHQMTPGQYRDRWGLPTSYPMVAPDYAAKRSSLAKKIAERYCRPTSPSPCRFNCVGSCASKNTSSKASKVTLVGS